MPDKRGLWKTRSPSYREGWSRKEQILDFIFNHSDKKKVCIDQDPEKIRCNELHAFIKAIYTALLKKFGAGLLSNEYMWKFLKQNSLNHQVLAERNGIIMTLIDYMDDQEIHWKNSHYRRQIMKRKTFDNFMAGLRNPKKSDDT